MNAAVLLGLVSAALISGTDSKIVCYWGSWFHDWPGNGKFDISDIDATLCTHVIYAFVRVTEDADIKTFDSWFDIEKNGFNDFVALKEQNSDLKVMAAVEGGNERSANFSKVVANPNSRSKLVKNIKNFISRNGFDGLDISWNYPVQRDSNKNDGVVGDSRSRNQFIENVPNFFSLNGLDGMDIAWNGSGQRAGNKNDITSRGDIVERVHYNAMGYICEGLVLFSFGNFVSLLKELRESFQPNGWILSASVPAVENSRISLGLDVLSFNLALLSINSDHVLMYFTDSAVSGGGQQSSSLDFLNLMYDDGIWNDVTRATAPLYIQLTNKADILNEVNASINAWIDAGISPKKLNLGISLYGRTDAGESGSGIDEELCDHIQNDADEWTVNKDKGNYANAKRSGSWIGHDIINTMHAKGTFARDLGVGGICFSSINFDDFRGSCGTPYPLVNAAIRGFVGS